MAIAQKSRQGNINYLNKWEAFKYRRTDVIKAYFNAACVRNQLVDIYKMLVTRQMVKKVWAKYHERIR